MQAVDWRTGFHYHGRHCAGTAAEGLSRRIRSAENTHDFSGMEAKHTINAIVENQPAVLSRVVGLFSGRGYNIESLNVGPCADPRFSRMTIVVPGDAHVLEQVTKQLNKLVDVVKVVDLTAESHVARELVLVEVATAKAARTEVISVANLFGAAVASVKDGSVTLQFTGNLEQVDDFIRLLRPYSILNLSRSGPVAVIRGE